MKIAFAEIKDCSIEVEFDGIIISISKWEKELFPFYLHFPVQIDASRSDNNEWKFKVSITAHRIIEPGTDRRQISDYLLFNHKMD